MQRAWRKFPFLSHFLPFLCTKANKVRVCLNFARLYFESCFGGYFSVVIRNVAGYVTKDNRKRDRKETKVRLDKNLKKENLNETK